MNDFSESLAKRMFSNALDRAHEKGETQQTVARRLGYKTSVVVSHMASGRAPVPVDRAMDIANVLGIHPGRFLLAVLQQRHPDITEYLTTRDYRVTSASSVVAELEELAGGPLESLPAEHLRIIKEVIAAREPAARWVTVSEVQALKLLRAAFPLLDTRGLTDAQRAAFEKALRVAATPRGGRR